MARRKPTPKKPPVSRRPRWTYFAAAGGVALLVAAAWLLFGRPAAPRENRLSTRTTPYSQPTRELLFDRGDFSQPCFRLNAGQLLFLHAAQTGSRRPAVTAYSLADGREIANFEASARLVRLALSPDEKTIAVAEGDGGIDILAAADLAPTTVLPGHTATPADLCFSPDSNHLLSVAPGEDGSAAVWSTRATRALLQTPKLEQPPTNGCWLPNGSQVLIWGRGHAALVWDLAAQKEIRRMLHPGGVLCAAVSPDGRWIVLAAGGIDFCNAETGELVKRQEDDDHGWPHPVAFSPDSKAVAEAIPNQRTIRLWRLEQAGPVAIAVTATFYQPTPTTAVAFSPDSGYLLARAQDGTIQIFDLTDNTEICKLVGPKGRDGDFRVSADGQYVVSTGAGGAKLWQFKQP